METEQQELTQDEAIEVSLKCGDDLKYLYQQILLSGHAEYQEAINGPLHDYLFDFLRWDELGNGATVHHTNLFEHIPSGGSVRWIYWPVMGKPPVVYDGDDHELGEKWKRGDLIKGVLIRIAGTGHNKYVLLPRGHLKTEIAHVAFALQEIIRDPSVRIMSKTHIRDLATEVLQRVKDAWDLESFARYFGGLKPELKEASWNEKYIQVRAPRRGVGHTVEASAVEVETVGKHPDLIILDDVIGFENLNKKEKVRQHVQTLAFLLGGEGRVLGIGTRYAPDDPHGLFLDHGTELFKSTSFMFATLTDETGEPTWKYMTPLRIDRLRQRCVDDFLWYCQMYNNPYQVESQRLKPEWWRRWPRAEDMEHAKQYEVEGRIAPEALAEALRLDICITLDPASSTRKRSDCSACIVQGQTQDREFRYVLDGFREKLSRDDLPGRFIDLVEHWHRVARRVRCDFRVGVEGHGLATYLVYPLKDEMRKRGFWVDIKELKSQNRHKNDRIYRLASPYMLGTVLFPESIQKNGYDLIAVLKHQFMHFPRGGDGEDDLLDAQAYQEDLLIPRPMSGDTVVEARKSAPPNDVQVEKPEGAATNTGLYVPPKFKGHAGIGHAGRWVPGRFRNG
jgi:hypothetical protein